MEKTSSSMTLLGGLLISLAFPSFLAAADWPQWRGPNQDGISTETGWQASWPDSDPEIAWTARVGMGYAAISVADGKAYTISSVDGMDHIWCFNADTGEEIWKYSYAEPLNKKFYDGGATCTPTIHEGTLYTISRAGKVFALDAASGAVKWQTDILALTEAAPITWGFVGSPVVHGDLLLLNVGIGGAALKKDSGELAWFSSKGEAGYSTPHLYNRDGKDLAIFTSGRTYTAREAATGAEVWTHKWVTMYGVNAADPILSGSNVFISTGYKKGSVLLNVSSGTPQEVYKTKALQTQMNPAVLVDGYLYGCDGNEGNRSTTLKCLELATGKEMWSFPGMGAGSQMVADGHLIVLSARGELFIAPISPEGFEPVLQMQVLGGQCWTVPVLSNGRLYVRNNERGDVVCLDMRPE